MEIPLSKTFYYHSFLKMTGDRLLGVGCSYKTATFMNTNFNAMLNWNPVFTS